MPMTAIKFPSHHAAAALSWPRKAGARVPLSVFLDAAEDGGDYVTVETTSSFGNGFHIAPDPAGVVISWDHWRQSVTAGDLIEAMQIIHPISEGDLAAVRASVGIAA